MTTVLFSVAAIVRWRTNLPPHGGSYKDIAVRNGRRSVLCSRRREPADFLPPYGGSYKDMAVRDGTVLRCGNKCFVIC